MNTVRKKKGLAVKASYDTLDDLAGFEGDTNGVTDELRRHNGLLVGRMDGL